MNIDEYAKLAAQKIKDKKATNVMLINVEKLTSVASYFIIATATSTTQARGVINYVEDELGKLKIEPIRKDTKNAADWVILDYGDILVHIMTSEIRELFNLEKLWLREDNLINF